MKALLALITLPAAMLAAGTASGTLTVQGQSMPMKYSYAVQIPDFFDKSKLGTRLVVSDAPIPEAAIQQDMELMSLARAGKMNAVQFEFGNNPSTYSMSILSNKLGGSLSVSKSFDPKSIPVLTTSKIEGRLAMEPSKLGPMSYQFNVKFSTAVAPRVVTPAPTPSDTSAAAGAASTKAYLEFVAAMKAGNKAKMLELSSPQVRKMMDQPDFAQKLAFVQSMMPSNIKVLKATETGDEAKLSVSGTEEGKTKLGTVTMMRQAGKWYLVTESWTSGNM